MGLKNDYYNRIISTVIIMIFAGDILKQVGIKIREKIADNVIKKIPDAVLIKINQKVGFRLITKFREKGVDIGMIQSIQILVRLFLHRECGRLICSRKAFAY